MAFFGLVFTLVIGVLLLVGGLQVLERLGRSRPEALPGVTPDRLDRLEGALAALDARLDRLEEQQRFVERLLEGREDSPRLPPSGPSAPDSVLFDVEEGTE